MGAKSKPSRHPPTGRQRDSASELRLGALPVPGAGPLATNPRGRRQRGEGRVELERAMAHARLDELELAQAWAALAAADLRGKKGAALLQTLSAQILARPCPSAELLPIDPEWMP